MNFKESMKMKDDQVVIRAAAYSIWNARTILDTYRNDQQPRRKIPIKDCQKILAGILYALAEGQHLDFSNTVLEMREEGKVWVWFESFTVRWGHSYLAKVTREYLESDEIYRCVHRVSPQQSVQGEQAKRVTKMTGSTAGL